jgi:glycine/D-amino acid oxidase-like deaminating enzyme
MQAMNKEQDIDSQSHPVVVLGAGAVGICTAAYLQRAGHKVVLIDRALPGQGGASLGNAGCLNPSSIVPMAMPGVLRKVPGWLLKADGPLVLRARHLPRMLPWLTRFVRAGQPANVGPQAVALRQLLKPCLTDYVDLARAANAAEMIHSQGNLVVYSSTAGFDGDHAAMSLRMDNGVRLESLDTTQLRSLEPNLAPEFTRGYLIRENGYLTDPGAFLKRIADDIQARGVQFRQTDIVGMRHNGARVSAVVTRDGVQPAKAVVIALGAWSGFLARELGDRVFLDTERGYHIEIEGAQTGPVLPTLWSEGKIVATPMQGRIRCAGTVEFAGLHAPPDWRRTTLLTQQLTRMYPALAPLAKDKGESLPRWLGFRPSTPDSLPVIGPSRRFPNAVYAFGHGHVGLTAGAPTGRLVAELLSDRTPAIDLAPFSIERFR